MTTTASTPRSPARCLSRGSSMARLGSASKSSRRTARTGAAWKALEAQEGTGYQFAQARGLIVMRTQMGLIACLPVGMAQVSSVVLTAEFRANLRKGEELGYFQFGGSDFVMVFEAACGVELDAEPERHRIQGERAGVCRR